MGVITLDLFSTKRIEREWISLQYLQVLDADERKTSVDDTKAAFISRFIMKQLIREGVIEIDTLVTDEIVAIKSTQQIQLVKCKLTILLCNLRQPQSP